MEAAVRLQTCTSHSNSKHKNCLLCLSKILPPSYLDTLIHKCLNYYERVFGQQEMWSLLEILKITNQERKSKHRTFHSITYNNHIYIGELDEKGRRHGLGRCHFSNGDVYKGNWKKDDMDGKGCYSWKDSSNVYLGHWLETNRNGNGVYAMNNKSKNFGEKNKNSETCRRMFKFVCGNWKDDRLMKDGKMIFVESW